MQLLDLFCLLLMLLIITTFVFQAWLNRRVRERKIKARRNARLFVGWETAEDEEIIDVQMISDHLAYCSTILRWSWREGFGTFLSSLLKGKGRNDANELRDALFKWRDTKQRLIIQNAPLSGQAARDLAPNSANTDVKAGLLSRLREVEAVYLRIAGCDENIGFLRWDQASVLAAICALDPGHKCEISAIRLYEWASEVLRMKWQCDGECGSYTGPNLRAEQVVQCRLEMARHAISIGSDDEAENWLRKTLHELENLDNEELKQPLVDQLDTILSRHDPIEGEMRELNWQLQIAGGQCWNHAAAISHIAAVLIDRSRFADAERVIGAVLASHRAHRCSSYLFGVAALTLLIARSSSVTAEQAMAVLKERLSKL